MDGLKLEKWRENLISNRKWLSEYTNLTVEEQATIEEDVSRIEENMRFIETAIAAKSQQANEDQALLTKEKKFGGINLDAKLLDLQIQRDGNGIPLPVSQQPIDKMKIDGFFPIIINVQPVNLPLLLGMKGSDGEKASQQGNESKSGPGNLSFYFWKPSWIRDVAGV